MIAPARPWLVMFLLLAAGFAWAAEEPALLAATDAIFTRPHDVELSPDGRYLYVADIGNDVVQVLEADTLRRVGQIGKGELRSPHDVSIDPRGRLLVADSGNDRIAIYELAGASGRFTGDLRGGLGSPEGVIAAPDGRIYVTNARLHNLVVFGPDGKAVASTGAYGSAPGQFVRPHDIDRDAAGNLYVADPGNNRIQVFDPALKFIRAIGKPEHSFHEPKYLAFDERGRLWIADEYNDRVRVLDGGRQVLEIGPVHGKAGKFNHPEGVVVKGDRAWISDTYNDRVLLFRLPPGF